MPYSIYTSIFRSACNNFKFKQFEFLFEGHSDHGETVFYWPSFDCRDQYKTHTHTFARTWPKRDHLAWSSHVAACLAFGNLLLNLLASNPIIDCSIKQPRLLVTSTSDFPAAGENSHKSTRTAPISFFRTHRLSCSKYAQPSIFFLRFIAQLVAMIIVAVRAWECVHLDHFKICLHMHKSFKNTLQEYFLSSSPRLLF